MNAEQLAAHLVDDINLKKVDLTLKMYSIESEYDALGDVQVSWCLIKINVITLYIDESNCKGW